VLTSVQPADNRFLLQLRALSIHQAENVQKELPVYRSAACASYGKRKIATSWLGTAAEAFTKPKAPKKPELPNRKSLVTES
jgi:hypothetical protein